MNQNLATHQAKAMSQLHSSRIASSIKHSQASNAYSQTSMRGTEDNQISVLKDTNNNDTTSLIRRFNIPRELLDSMEEQRIENYLRMPELDLKMYENKKIITYLSFAIHQVHTVDLMYSVLIPVHLITASETRHLKGLSVILDVHLFQ